MIANKKSVYFAVLILSAATLVWAGCKTDCKDDYESAVESCKSLYDDPEDSDMLSRCIQTAKDDYESCIEECED
jgi:hypothetical protein